MEKYRTMYYSIANHVDHVQWQKTQLDHLFNNFQRNTIITRADFIENWKHYNAQEPSSAHFGKSQTSIFIITVWHHAPNSTPSNRQINKVYFTFVSENLKHSTGFVQKCFAIMISQLDIAFEPENVINLTDGASQHFKNRKAMFWGSKFWNLFQLRFRWAVDPAYHGKGSCDGRGATLKSNTRLYLLDSKNLLKLTPI